MADAVNGDMDLIRDFGIEIIGLTQENIEKLQNYLLPLIIEETKKIITQ